MADMVGKKVEIAVLFDMVKITIHCGDDYESQVLYDDLIDRMRSGEGISLGVKPSNQSADT